jgi:hypothetical protein
VTDGTSIFWADSGNLSLQGRILTCDVDCVRFGWTTLAAGLDGPVGLAVDASHVYFTSPSAGTVQRCPEVAPCAPETIATGQGGASSIAVNDRGIYWTLPGDGVTPGRVMVLAK